MPVDTFRCYAYRHKDGYYAICLDLLLIVRRDTMDQAINELQDVITGYLEDAYANGGWDEDLVPRSAPWEDWLRYYWLLILNAIKAIFGRFRSDFLAFNWRLEKGALVYA